MQEQANVSITMRGIHDQFIKRCIRNTTAVCNPRQIQSEIKFSPRQIQSKTNSVQDKIQSKKIFPQPLGKKILGLNFVSD